MTVIIVKALNLLFGIWMMLFFELYTFCVGFKKRYITKTWNNSNCARWSLLVFSVSGILLWTKYPICYVLLDEKFNNLAPRTSVWQWVMNLITPCLNKYGFVLSLMQNWLHICAFQYPKIHSFKCFISRAFK